MARFPADSESRRVDSRACAIVHYAIDSNHWEYKLETGGDFGCDAILELSENNYWTGNRVRVQIKGTRHIDRYLVSKGAEISFPLSVDTLNYTLTSPESFLLFVVDIESEAIYYCELHEHLSSHANLVEKMESQQKVSIRFSRGKILESGNDAELQAAARRRFAPDGNGWFIETTIRE